MGVVVVGVDGSDRSVPALEWAAGEAAAHGHALRVVTAWSIPVTALSPGGLPAPNQNWQGIPGPETGLILKFDPADSKWKDQLARDWTQAVRFTLPDYGLMKAFLRDRGYMIVTPIRPGHGVTGGPYFEDQGRCQEPDFVKSGLATAASIYAVSAYGQGQDFSKVEVKVTPLGHDTYMLEGAGGNVEFAIGQDGVIQVDGEFAPMHDKIKAAIDKISGGKPIKYLINTHFHGDHTFGNDAFKAEGATFVAHKETQRIMQLVHPKEMARRMAVGIDQNRLSLLLAVKRSSSSLHLIWRSAPNCLSWPTILEKLLEARENWLEDQWRSSTYVHQRH